MIKEELLSSLLENVDEKELGINEAVRNANQPGKTIQIIKKYKILLKGESKMIGMVGRQEDYLNSLKNENSSSIMKVSQAQHLL